MQIVDTIVSRESDNSAWANVVFLGDRGESVSVRLACPVPTGGAVGRSRIIKRASELLRGMVERETFDRLGEQTWSVQAGRFGVPSEAPVLQQRSWRDESVAGEE